MAPSREILRRRESIESRLSVALEQSESSLTVSQYKETIFHGPDISQFQAYILEALEVFGYHIDDAPEEIISVIQDAWNYFPHQSLQGRCPAELNAELTG
jgi:hypothetical protein